MNDTATKGGSRLYRALKARLPWLARWLHLVLFPAVLIALDAGFRYICRFASAVGSADTMKLLPFTLGWALVFTAIAALLPRRARQVFMLGVGAVFCLLCVVHGIFINLFRKFFSFSDMAFAGDGAAFVDISYLLVIRKVLLLWIIGCFLLVVLAALLTPPDSESRPIPAVCGAVLGVAMILTTRFAFLGQSGVVIWDEANDPAFIYEDFSDTRAALSLVGLYQYTFRDLQRLLPRRATLSADELAEVETYASGRQHQDNEMSGLLEGKNLILVQLEAIDTWMLEYYMPNLKALKDAGISFSNHYTPAYIAAGTFNTEFMVNAGLLPAAPGVSASVYSQNSFPNSLAHLFREKGYSANSFHGSERDIYNRGPIHENWGYEAYHSGTDMGMADFRLDSQLIGAFDQMVSDDPFFTFIITYSGHGPYSAENPIFLAHEAEARAAAKRTEDVYVYAVGHAMETDAFIGELVDALKASGHMDDTVLAFYADHYDYYLLNDELDMEIKGVDSINMLSHTDFFIYSQDIEPQTVEKYTSSLDVLPTLANMFGLDAQYELLTGDDAFSDAGGYVIFNDNTWTGSDADLSQEIIQRRRISGMLLSGNYWAGENS